MWTGVLQHQIFPVYYGILEHVSLPYLFLQHQPLSSQVPLKGDSLFHQRTGLPIDQDVIDTLLPISEQQTGRLPRVGPLRK